MNTTQSIPAATFVLATDLTVGMVTSLGPIASIDKTTKNRVYYTIDLRTGGQFQDWTAKDGRCAILA